MASVRNSWCFFYACGSDSSGLFSCRFCGEVVLVANWIKDITMEIGGDTTKLQTALKGVNSEIRNT